MKNYLFIVLILCSFASFSQHKVNKKAINNFNKAQEYLQQYNYKVATSYLKEAVKSDPKYQEAFVQLGDIFKYNKEYEQANSFYLQGLAIAPSTFKTAYFSLGESELSIGDYKNAQEHLTAFLSITGIDPVQAATAKKYLADCTFSLIAIQNPVPFNPVNMGNNINSVHRDYFPTLTADGEIIIFTRQINGNEDFFISRLKNHVWEPAVPLSNHINTVQFNEGAQSITPDGSYLFFTGCNRPDGLGRCDIYVSAKEGNDWGVPVNLGAPLNSPYWESQPAISPDGNTLYFVSNRPGGYGGYDIYTSTVGKDGTWTNPKNLGPLINSAFDENTPFIHPDGKTLYFSSDGWPGLGKKDLFCSRMDNTGQWGKPVNIGYPINTSNDETGLTVTSDGLNALFSSDLIKGFGNHDIYTFKMPQHAMPLPVTYVKGVIKDRKTGAPVNANVLVKNLQTSGVVFDDYTSSETGSFLIVMPLGSNYAFNVKAAGYLFYSENYPLLVEKPAQPTEIEILLDKMEIGVNVTLKNIFFENNKFELLPASVNELTTLVDFLSNNPSVEIEIQGHTDNKGDDDLNNTLSLNRAKSVYNYLIDQHIDVKRLTYKGFGKSKPIADNATEEGQQQNRRTSFLITKI